MKKWITQKEIAKIIKTYSVRKDEFELVSNINYCYQSNLVKGYMITLSEEQNGIEKTGRIIVSHTQDDGKRTYVDVWERDKNNNLQFRFRNLWNQPLSDAEYIKDLENQIEKLKQAGRELQVQLQENQKLINENPTAQMNTDFIRKLELEAMGLKKDNIELKEENQKLINEISEKTRHNARNAGRKPSGERKEAVERTRKLLESGASNQEIMEKLKISKATLFRYKKSINN